MRTGGTHPLFRIGEPVFLRRLIAIESLDEERIIVEKVCDAFSRMPYENLTKIIKRREVIGPSSARRLPDEVIADHLAYGTGGTCFSLTAALVAALRHFGVEAHPILADRRYGSDTHCAALIMTGGDLFVVDPGYLLHRPVPLPAETPVVVENPFNIVELMPEGPRRVALYTRSGADRKYRLTYKIAPVDGEAFGVAWDRSFGWEMMTYPVLTRVTAAEHYYLQGGDLRIRRGGRTERRRLDREGNGRFVAEVMGIAPAIVERAFRLVDDGASRSR